MAAMIFKVRPQRGSLNVTKWNPGCSARSKPPVFRCAAYGLRVFPGISTTAVGGR